eukprot:6680048-Pyramimonas_sp.AAC.1
MHMHMGSRQEPRGRDGMHHQVELGTLGLRGPRSLRCRSALRKGAAVEPVMARRRGGVQEA